MQKATFYIKREINKIEKEISNKKIIVFGASARINAIYECWDFSSRVIFFVDNNPKLWGDNFLGKEVCSPEKLYEIQNVQEVIIFVLSPHRDAIIKQIQEMQLSLDYVDIMQFWELQGVLDLHLEYTQKFKSFLEREEEELFVEKKEIISDKPIGIIIQPSWPGSWCYYSIMLFLLLRYRGYDAKLIVDNIHGIWDYVVYDGITAIFNDITNEIVEYIQERIPSTDIVYMSDFGYKALTELESKEATIIAKKTVTWMKGMKAFKVRFRAEEKIIEDLSKILKETMGVIKSFFSNHDFRIINTYTGLYGNAGLCECIAKQKHIRMTSYDSSGQTQGRLFFSKDGMVGDLSEVADLLESGRIDDDLQLKEKMLANAMTEWNKQQMSTKMTATNSYQIVATDAMENEIDVLIPLNIEWDAAAVAVDSAFETMREWLLSTVDYLLKNTDARVMVREHPAKALFKEYSYLDYKELLNEKFGADSRLIFVGAEEPVNTYRQMEKSKLVLVHSSTVGMEAVLMDKPVLLCTDVYYHCALPNLYVKNKKDYFNRIEELLAKGYDYSARERESILLAYEFHKHLGITTDFNEVSLTWMERSMLETNQLEVVQFIVNTIAEDESYIYQVLKNA